MTKLRSSIDPARFLHDQLASASPDLLRSMLATFVNALMSAEADAVCGAPYGAPFFCLSALRLYGFTAGPFGRWVAFCEGTGRRAV